MVGGGAIQTSWLASGKGSGRSRSVLTTLKTAMLAPMPRARMRTATMVNPGSRPRVRKVYFSVLQEDVEFHKAPRLPVHVLSLVQCRPCSPGPAGGLPPADSPRTMFSSMAISRWAAISASMSASSPFLRKNARIAARPVAGSSCEHPLHHPAPCSWKSRLSITPVSRSQ